MNNNNKNYVPTEWELNICLMTDEELERNKDMIHRSVICMEMITELTGSASEEEGKEQSFEVQPIT